MRGFGVARAVTVDPEQVFAQSGLPRTAPTFSQSINLIREESEGTAAAILSRRWEISDENLLGLWRQTISSVVAEIVRNAVAEYVERYYESAEESTAYRYVAEAVTTGSAERVRAIRETRFGTQERVVIYTPEELRDFF
jgi:hypothetical protein